MDLPPERIFLRQSLASTLAALGVCGVLLALGIVAIVTSAVFLISAILFTLLIVGFIFFVIWGAALRTEIGPSGVSHRNLFSSYEFNWDEISEWGLEQSPNEDRSVWFRVSPGGKQYPVQITDSRLIANSILLFNHYCGKPSETKTDHQSIWY
jgi:hypothetical protein